MDSEEIVTNEQGGKQSKLYTAYHLIDPWALQCLSAIHHRGSIKYAVDNWRKIGVEEHINHAIHHLVQHLKIATFRRSGPDSPLLGVELEDHLAHAMCRVTFALAKEIEGYGIHPEHSDPTYHEPKATPLKQGPVRLNDGGLAPVQSIKGFDESPRSFATIAGKAGRNNPKRASSARSSAELGIGPASVHRGGRRRRPTTHRRK